jgi:hypothetical protein
MKKNMNIMYVLFLKNYEKEDFLGYIVSGDGISMDEKKIQTIVEWIVLSFVRDVQCFLGFANFYRIFIKDYSKIVALLTRLIG